MELHLEYSRHYFPETECVSSCQYTHTTHHHVDHLTNIYSFIDVCMSNVSPNAMHKSLIRAKSRKNGQKMREMEMEIEIEYERRSLKMKLNIPHIVPVFKHTLRSLLLSLTRNVCLYWPRWFILPFRNVIVTNVQHERFPECVYSVMN